METIFFDYYHPYAGLCNQLYLLTNHIHNAYLTGKKIYIHKFNIDIFKKNRVNVDLVFDLEKTNENLKQLTGIELISLDPPKVITFIPKLFIYPVSSISILNCLEFNKSIVEKVETFKRMYKSYYAIHFRIEIDVILHYTYGKQVYNKFMDLANNNQELAKEYFETLDKKIITDYCNFLMGQYIVFLKKIGFDKKWYICTSKSKFDYFNVYLDQLIKTILENGGDFIFNFKCYQERELNALVDLLILRDCEKMIGFEGSSFSEGYCYKVNQIRKVIKECLFVKERNEF
jgi:hypothetical protein